MTRILCVYINGTDDSNSFPEKGIISLASLLHRLTDQGEKTVASICLNGCGIGNYDIRDLGFIFAWNLERQINQLVREIETDYLRKDDKLILNVYGFSRGGVAAFLLCKKLKHIPSIQLEINVLAFEPVPGNFITSVYADKLLSADSTLSGVVSDLRDCTNINRMHVLFTYQPLPDIACHGPILPAMPSCNLSVDVIPGCHRDAEIFVKNENSIKPYNDQSAIAFHQVANFLQKCGTVFNFSKFALNELLNVEDKKSVLELYNRQLWKIKPTSRSMHFSNTIYANPKPGKFLNCYHQFLAEERVVHPEKCVLGIEDRNPIPSYRNGQKSAARIVVPVLLFSAAAILYKKYSSSFGATGSEEASRLKF